MTGTKSNDLLGVAIGSGTLEEVTARSLAALDAEGDPVTFACANPHSLVVAQDDPDFCNAMREATLVVADGIGVSVIGRLLGIDVGKRITGADYFFSILDALAARGGGKVFFFGSSPFVLSRIEEAFLKQYPTLTLSGCLSPPYREWSDAENDRMIQKINAANPDVLWVGMTAPKQEKWVAASLPKLNARIIGSIGAVFDFYAGTYPRAPHWICRIGLEWLYRLAREPRRMWRRTMVSGPRFLVAVVRRHLLGQEPVAHS